jgi:hypothetical protein
MRGILAAVARQRATANGRGKPRVGRQALRENGQLSTKTVVPKLAPDYFEE